MRTGKLCIGFTAVFATIAVTLLATGTRAVAQETILYSFTGGADGALPYAGLIFDAAGNLYGTTQTGGTFGNGTVFELSPQAGGGWIQTVLHQFGKKDGIAPEAPFVFDVAGNLYGTTAAGGLYGLPGTVFELKPQAGGGWTETILHNFRSSSKDGSNPAAGLIWDTAGNLYGTTNAGGAYGWGTVFELSPQAGGGWTEKVLHAFGNGTDGRFPALFCGLIFDSAGNLYGTTTGDLFGVGESVFELLPQAGGGWKEARLANFSTAGNNPNSPAGGLVFDSAGNLYSTTYYGGLYSGGTVFELSPKVGGGWTAKVIHNFGGPNDGLHPSGPLLLDATGNLYGTTKYGGSVCAGGTLSCGTVFELTPQAGGGWMETVLYSFGGTVGDGAIPFSGLIQDSAGNLYGTTSVGGSYNEGTVFEIAH